MELSSKIIEDLTACSISSTKLLIAFSAKDDAASDYNIYVSIVDISGNALHTDILIDDYSTDSTLP